MTTLEKCARAICEQNCFRGRVLGAPCIGEDGRNTPCKANRTQLSLGGPLQSVKAVLTALLDLDEGTVEAMSTPAAVKEVEAMIGFNAARNVYRLGWSDRGEEPPLVQSFKAAIQHVINEGEGT